MFYKVYLFIFRERENIPIHTGAAEEQGERERGREGERERGRKNPKQVLH